MKLFGSNLSVSLLRDVVGVGFYSNTELDNIGELNGPWLATSLLSYFTDMPGVDVRVPKRRKENKKKTRREGSAAECFLSNIKFDKKGDNDVQIRRFGEKLAQFLLGISDNEKNAENNRYQFSINNEAFVRAYAKRRLESGDGLSGGEVKNHAISSTQQEMLPMTNKEVLCALYDKLMNSDDRKSAVEGYKTFCEKVSQANEAEDLSLKEWLYENVVYMKEDNGVAPLGQNNQIPERDRLKQDEFFQVLDDMLSAAKTPGAEVRYAEWKNCFSAAIKKKNEKAKEQNYVFNRIIAAFFPAKVTPIPSAGGFKKIYTWMLENGFLNDEKKAGDWYGQNKAVMQALDEVFNDRSEIDEYCKGCFAWQLFACLDEGCDPMDLIKGGVPTPGNRELTDEEKMIKEILRANLNLVLTGAPGTGKTYMAKRVAKDLAKDEWEVDGSGKGEWKNGRIAFVQFHPGYDYSDFVIGMKPVLITETGEEVEKRDGKYFLVGTKTRVEKLGKAQVSFRWKDGIFKKFADKAKQAYEEALDKENAPKFVFLIDEINRADLSRVFGELFSLLEEEYRHPNANGTDIILPNGEPFVIPENLYIIGTMNDIDRSVESMDFALRRRFAWYEVTAASSRHIIRKKVKNVDESVLNKLEVAMDALNGMIAPKPKKSKAENGDVPQEQTSEESIDLRLGSEYQLGGAIFAKFEKYQGEGDDAFRKLWHNHIENILKEYLRGRSDRDGRGGVMDKLKQAYKKAVGLEADPE